MSSPSGKPSTPGEPSPSGESLPTGRLVELESLIAYQDKLLEDLNEVVTGQEARLDALERQVARLAEQQRSAPDAEDGVPEPPPPHY